MYVQGVSTRKVKTITEELCGHAFSASSISRINKTLDDELKKPTIRRLDEEYPYLILDARYEKVREDGVIRTRAVMIAIGINWDGRRSVLAVELANRESQTSWKECLVGLKQRGLAGLEFVVSDHHLGLKKAIGDCFPKQSGNAATYTFCAMPWITFRGRPTTIACRNCDGSRNLEEARRDLGAWLAKWQKKYPRRRASCCPNRTHCL
jgi:putative transposase